MAEQTNVLIANVRTETGKGAARRSRRAGLLPAVMYGHGIDPVHLDLPGHDTFLIVKDSANPIITVKYDGKQQLVLVREIQRHPVRRDLLHLDLLVVRADEKVQVEVPVLLLGDPEPGTQTQQEEFTLLISAPATSIPEAIEVSIEGLGEGVVVRVEDLDLPEGVTSETPAERDIVTITAITESEDLEEAEDALEEAVAEAHEDADAAEED